MQNQLVIGTTDTKTRFLDESELPDHAKIHSISGTPSEIETEDQMLAEALKKSAQEAAGMYCMSCGYVLHELRVCSV